MTNFNDLTQDQLDAFEAKHGWIPEEEAEYICEFHLDQYADMVEDACRDFAALGREMLEYVADAIWTDVRILEARRFYDIMNAQLDAATRDKCWKEDVLATIEGQLEVQGI